MTQALGDVEASEPQITPSSRRRMTAGIVGIAVFAFLVRLHYLLSGGGLLVAEGYDDGVYYAAADALVHGLLPYRDFLFLQPPAISVLLAPFAWFGTLTSDAAGTAVARLAFMVIGAANAALVALTLRRFGWQAAAVGGVLYAVAFPAVYTERTTGLEPIGTAGVLVALLLTTIPPVRRPLFWAVVAGVALGIATSTKAVYVVPALVIIGFAHRRIAVAASAVAATVLICLPFFVQAPSTMFREVVLDQLGRPAMTVWTLRRRLRALLGQPTTPANSPVAFLASTQVTAVLCILLLVAILLIVRDRRSWVFIVLVLATGALLISGPTYFLHYSILATMPAILVVGIAGGRLAQIPRSEAIRLSLVATMTAAFIISGIPRDGRLVADIIPSGKLRPAAAKVHCVTSDDPTTLAVIDTLSRDLAAGCKFEADLTGYNYDQGLVRSQGKVVTRLHNPKWQRYALRYLASGDANIVVRVNTGLTKPTLSRLHSGGKLAGHGAWTLWATDH